MSQQVTSRGCFAHRHRIPIACLALSLSSSATASAQVEVDGRGALATSVAIDVPGFHGIAPAVRLAYQSSVASGLAGAGWNLTAGSRITRTSATGGISALAADDRYWLDGAELVPCAAGSASPSCASAIRAFGSAAGFYSTRIESFRRVRRDPGGWTVWDRDGTISSYVTGDGEASYPLRVVRDPHGNRVDYEWTCTAGCELDAIRYGQTGAGPGTEVRFYREPRPDPWSERNAAGVVRHDQRLRSIAVRGDGQLVRAYRLGYGQSLETGASILTSVQQFANDADVDASGVITPDRTTPLPARTFATASLAAAGQLALAAEPAPPGAFGVATPLATPLAARYPGAPSYVTANPTLRALGDGEIAPQPYGYIVGDFNGDGRAELATWALHGACQGNAGPFSVTLQVYRTDGSGALLAPVVTTHLPATTQCGAAPRAFVADTDGDGADDVVMAIDTQLQRYQARGDGTFAAGPSAGWDKRTGGCTVADVDGDGRDDLVCEQPTSRRVIARRATQAGWITTELATNLGAAPSLPDHTDLALVSGDVDGDGLGDVLLVRAAAGSTRVVLGRSLGDGAFDWSQEQSFPFTGDFAVADVDGDGQLDLTWTRRIGVSPERELDVALARKGYSAARWRLVPRQIISLSSTQLADVDGDGRADVIGLYFDDLHVQRATGDGTFGAAEAALGTCATTGPAPNVLAADWNGDGMADPTCLTSADPDLGEYEVTERPAQPHGTDRHRWQRADLDGDGRTELAYVEYRNPGYVVHAVDPQNGARTSFFVSAAGRDGLHEADATRWIFADVGSPGGPADGKDDLVLVENLDGQLVVTTLLSTGAGSFSVVQQGAGETDIDSARGWFAAADDRDGRSALMRAVADAAGGVRVQLLRPDGGGLFGLSDVRYFAAGSAAPLTDRAVRGFKPTDLDGDGLTDLVQIDAAGPGQPIVRSLRANGAGGFVAAVTALPTMTPIGSRAARVADLDGDGAADIYQVARTPGAECLAITHLAGDGRGGFTPSTYGGAACMVTPDPLYTRLFESSSAVIAADLDHDGRGELLHVSHALDARGVQQLIVTRLTRDRGAASAAWRAAPFLAPPFDDAGDAWSWTPYRDPATGDAGLAYVAPSASVVLRWSRVRDELITERNGLGLVTSVAYGPLPGARGYLPAAYVPRVVTQVTTSDLGEAPATSTTVRYGYEGATWSDERGGLAGFTTTSANDGNAVKVARYAIGEACGAQLTQHEVRSGPGGPLFGYTQTSYRAPGAAAPFLCQVATTTALECEATATCRTATSSTLSYDDYGNVSVELANADRAPSAMTITQVVPNDGPYIVDHVSTQTTVGLDPDGWHPRQHASFSYDHQPAGVAPLVGDVTARGEHDDQRVGTAVTTFDYDARGNLIARTSPEGRRLTYAYDPGYQRYLVRACDALFCRSLVVDLSLGLPTVSIEPDGTRTVTYRDGHGRVERIERPDGGYTATVYLDFGNATGPLAQRQRVRTMTRDNSAGDGSLVSERWFDGSGRTYRTSREDGATTTTVYADASARPAAISNVHDANASPGWWTTYGYDSIGRLVLVSFPDGETRETWFTVGVRTEADELGATHRFALDGVGKTVAITDPAGGVTAYQYDALGRLVGITDPLGNREQRAWSSRGLVTMTSDPDRGVRYYSYTQDGRLAATRDARGVYRGWSYDAIGRLMYQVDDDGDGNITRSTGFTYDASNLHGTSAGKLVQIDDNHMDTAIGEARWYDRMGRVNQTRRCVDGTCVSEATTFDLAGRIAAIDYPDGAGNLGTPGVEHVAHSYDRAGRLTAVGMYAGLGYELDDRLASITFMSGSQHFGYTPERRWLSSIDMYLNDFDTITYARDARGRVTSQNETGAVYDAQLVYRYDALGRLIAVDSFDPGRHEAMTYDAIGRLRSTSTLGDYRYDDPAHVHAMTSTTGGARRSYDANGNVTELADPGGRHLALTWTTDDRLASVTDLQTAATYGFVYDFEGHRVKKVDPSGTTLYFGPRVEIGPDHRMVKSYFAGDRLVARFDGTTYKALVLDAAHNLRRMLDSWNLWDVERYDYRAFGAPLIATASGEPDSFGFAGARIDRSLGLVEMGARTYDPVTGQFLSADSVIPSLARPQSLNRYSYAENDPINYWDPSGHMRLSVEMRKARIEEEPGVPTIEASLARILELGWAWIDRGMTMDQALKIQLGHYKASHPSPPATPARAAEQAPGTGGSGPGTSIPGNILAMVEGGVLETIREVKVSGWGDGVKAVVACIQAGGGASCVDKLAGELDIDIAGAIVVHREDGKITDVTIADGPVSIGMDSTSTITTKVEVEKKIGPATVGAGAEARTEVLPDGPRLDGNDSAIIGHVSVRAWISAKIDSILGSVSREERVETKQAVQFGMGGSEGMRTGAGYLKNATDAADNAARH